MATKHTPTPWRRSTTNPFAINTAEGGASRAIAEVSTGEWMPDVFVGANEAIANAEFIVRACNSHDELLAALSDVCDGVERASSDNVAGANMRLTVTALRELIAKAAKP